jgi:methyl-accepting chemotaxis protein
MNRETGHRQREWYSNHSDTGSFSVTVNTKRSQIIIKNEFQQKLILNTLLITLITLNVIIIVASLLDGAFGSGDSMLNIFNVSVAGMEIVAVVIVYYVGRKISFHIAGPVYAIERTLGYMKEGDLAQNLKLRPGDHFVEVADEINALIANYRERLIRAKELLGEGDQLSPQQLKQLHDELHWFITYKEQE